MNLHGILNKGQGRLGVGRGTAMAVVVGLAMMGGIATAVTASAHTPSVTTTCEGLTVDLVSYLIDPGHAETFHTETVPAVGDPTILVDNPDYVAATEATTHTEWKYVSNGHSDIWRTDNSAEHIWYNGHWYEKTSTTKQVSNNDGTPAIGTPKIEVPNPDYVPAHYVQVSNHDFRAPGTNHVVVTVNGTEVANNPDFGTSYNHFFAFLSNQVNTYKVVVTAWDGPNNPRWSKTFEGTVQGCVVVTHPVTLPTVTPPTCDAAGIVTLPTSDFYEWKLLPDSKTGVYTAVPKNGSTLSGTLTFGPVPLAQLNCPVLRTPGVPVTPPTFVPGTCTDVGWVVANDASAYEWVVTGVMTARSYAAVAKAGFTLTGTTSFGPFDLSQIPAQSLDAAALCYVAPPAVAGVVKNAPVKAAPVKAAPVKAAPAPAVAPAVKTLAFTGAETVPLGLSGLLALLLGAVLTVASRQRPKKARE